MFRTRILDPLPDQPKYIQPAGSTADPYFTLGPDWKKAGPVCIVEGEKKATAAWKYLGLRAVGIGGCHSWKAPAAGAKPSRASLHQVHPLILTALGAPGATVDIVFDGDYQSNYRVEHGLAELCIALRSQGYLPRVVVLPDGGESKVGLDDWIVATRPKAKDYKALPRHDGTRLWDGLPSIAHRSRVRTKETADGTLTIPVNGGAVYSILTNHPGFQKDCWFNDFTKKLHHGDRELTDGHTLDMLFQLQKHVNAGTKKSYVEEALGRLHLAPEFVRNPLRDYLDALVWDEKPRLATFFTNYCNANADPAEYLKAVGENWFTSLVARVYQPGCKVDTMLILEGKQGIGKSRVLRAIGGPLYRESRANMDDKDFLLGLQGAWILDISELASLNRSEQRDIKAILSSQEDEFRLPYGRLVEKFPRRAVIVGTTNEDRYLTDDTGARRYWPVRCGYTVEVALVEQDRDQLLAEAVHRYKTLGDWWTMPGEYQQQVTDARGVISPYFDEMQQHTADILALPRMLVRTFDGSELVYAYTTVQRAYTFLRLDSTHFNMARAKQIASALKGCGFEHYEGARPHQFAPDSGEAQRPRTNVFRKLLGSMEKFTLVPNKPKPLGKIG